MTPHVKIKPRETAPNTYVTDVLVYFGGQNYCSRLNYLVSDTPEQRALQAQLFKKRHNARVAEDHYGATQPAVTQAITCHDDLIAFAKEGSPILATLEKPKRPALRIIK